MATCCTSHRITLRGRNSEERSARPGRKPLVKAGERDGEFAFLFAEWKSAQIAKSASEILDRLLHHISGPTRARVWEQVVKYVKENRGSVAITTPGSIKQIAYANRIRARWPRTGTLHTCWLDLHGITSRLGNVDRLIDVPRVATQAAEIVQDLVDPRLERSSAVHPWESRIVLVVSGPGA